MLANRHRSDRDRDRDRGTERNRENRRGETEGTDPHTEKWHRQKETKTMKRSHLSLKGSEERVVWYQ
jgi:hypothetical protein